MPVAIRRLARRVPTGAAIALTATLFLWGLSYINPTFRIAANRGGVHGGLLWFCHDFHPVPNGSPEFEFGYAGLGTYWLPFWYTGPYSGTRLGLVYVTAGGWAFQLPLWVPGITCLAVIGHRVRRLLREDTESGGHYCSNCGYDLRASKSVCPECGLSVERKAN